MNIDELIQEGTADGGSLSPQQAAEILRLAIQGDTGEEPEKGGAPATSDGDEKTSSQAVQAPENDASKANDEGKGTQEIQPDPKTGDPDNPVILAKDGVHTIAYDKLVEARAAAQDWKSRAEEAQARIAQLQSEASARAKAGEAETRTDANLETAKAAIEAGVDADLFGDFSPEALAAGVNKLLDQRLDQRMGERIESALAKIDEKLKPIEARSAEDAAKAHFDAIYAKYPDADSIVESQELADWIGKQPSYAQQAIANVLQQGSSQQVIELFDQFKAATGKAQTAAPTDTTPKVDPKEAAKAAIAKAQPAVPASLSDIPGGTPAAGSEDAALANLSGPELLAAIQQRNWSAAQIEAFLNRQI